MVALSLLNVVQFKLHKQMTFFSNSLIYIDPKIPEIMEMKKTLENFKGEFKEDIFMNINKIIKYIVAHIMKWV